MCKKFNFEDLAGLPAEGEILPYLLPNSADQLVKPGTLKILETKQ